MRRGLPLFERGACLIILPQRFKGGGEGGSYSKRNGKYFFSALIKFCLPVQEL